MLIQPRTMTKIVLLTFYLLTKMVYVIWCDCRFPDYVLDPLKPWDTWRFWYMAPDDKYADEPTHDHRAVLFRGEKFVIDYGWDQKSTTHYCQEEVTEVGEDTYLVLIDGEEDEESEISYVCIQLIKRTDFVVQLRWSGISGTADTSLCSAPLELVDSPLISRYWQESWQIRHSSVNASYATCPIVGGYVLHKWTNETGTVHCKDSTVPIRLEYDCEKGEGLQIVLSDSSCTAPFDNLLYFVQDYVDWLGCWEQDDFIFTLVRLGGKGNYVSDVYCFRWPTNSQTRSDQFEVLVFFNGACHAGTSIPQGRKYRRLFLQRFPITSVCADISPNCGKPSAEDCSKLSFSEYDVCRSTCKTCKEFTQTAFSDEFQGVWLQERANFADGTVQISGSSLTIPELGHYKNLNECSVHEVRPKPMYSTHTTETINKRYVVMATYNNGCRPRLFTLHLMKRADAVLSYQISKATTSIFYQTDFRDGSRSLNPPFQVASHCPGQYGPDRSPAFDMYHQQYGDMVNLYRSAKKYSHQECQIHNHWLSETFDYSPTPETNCYGSLYYGPQSREFSVYLYGCRSTNITEYYVSNITTEIPSLTKKTADYNCLSSFRDHSGIQYILAKYKSGFTTTKHEFICWIFKPDLDRYSHMVYQVPFGDCNSGASIRIEQKFLTPYATFEFRPATASVGSCYARSIVYVIALTVTLSVRLFRLA